MRVVTNPGSNLPAHAVERYGIVLTPQHIVVDGESYDTREPISHDRIDGWVSSAKEHPYVVGTTAAEFVGTLRPLAKAGERVVAVMTSQKIIKSFDAANAAIRTVRELPDHADFDAVVVDSGVTDAGAGLATILAAEAARAGLSTTRIAEVIEVFRKEARFVFTVSTLDYLVKGGRATPLRAWLADLFKLRPIIGFVDGELKPIGKMKASANPALAIADALATDIPRGARIWSAVFYGGSEGLATALDHELRTRYEIEWSYLQPLSPSIYLHGGRGCVGACIVPLDPFPWRPPRPSL